MGERIAVVSANIGGFEKPVVHTPQSIPCDFYSISDGDAFPLRIRSMTPRLQARIVKTHMWQFVPGYDYYLWIDSSCRLSHKDSVKWFMEQLGDADIAVFKHPHRNTVQEEADYLKERLALEKSGRKQEYIVPRYEGEDIDGQLEAVDPSDTLLATTAFIYKYDLRTTHQMMKQWWYYISRYHSIDQLSLPYLLFESSLNVKIIEENYLKIPWIEHVRNK